MFDRLKRGVDVAKFKADQLMRVNRVQNEIGALQREIQNVREKIANDVIDLHKQTALSHGGLDELCVQIDQFEAQIGQKEKQIEEIRAEQPAPAPAPAAQQVIDAEPVTAAVAQPESSAGKCTNCGFALPANAEFCPECGTRVGTAEVDA